MTHCLSHARTLSLALLLVACAILSSGQDRTPPRERRADSPKALLQPEDHCPEIRGATSAEQLVEAILGTGITYSNVSFQGILHADAAQASAGLFAGADCVPLGFNDGIILSSGKVGSVVGPNINTGNTGRLNLPGDPDLEALVPGSTTWDATWLKFSFVPEDNYIFIQYVFGSEEYNTYVNGGYNDVFAFFVNGTNIALIPGTSIPVAIDNVNNGMAEMGEFAIGPCNHCNYYRDNANLALAPYYIEANGMTTVLTATATVVPGAVNSIKITITDTGDDILDSWVFIKAGSFTTEVPEGDLSIQKQAGAPQVFAGDPLDFTIRVTNEEELYIDNVLITDQLAEEFTFISASHDGAFDEDTRTITWEFDGIQGKETIELEVVVEAKADVPHQAIVENRAWVTSTYNPLPLPSNEVEVQINQSEFLFMIPNAFMPDSHLEENRTFKPVFWTLPEQYRLSIFNRWGSSVFYSEDPETGWNGVYENADSPMGTYTYKVVFMDENDRERQHTGLLMLVR